MQNIQRLLYIRIVNGGQPFRFTFCSREGKIIEKSEFYRQISAYLEELDYTELYSAYSGSIRKSQVEPRILFEILVYAYAIRVYSSRKIRALCKENVQFTMLLDGKEAPDHTTIARFRNGKKTGKAIENLFKQNVALLEKIGETDHEAVFIDGTELESKANQYTFLPQKAS